MHGRSEKAMAPGPAVIPGVRGRERTVATETRGETGAPPYQHADLSNWRLSGLRVSLFGATDVGKVPHRSHSASGEREVLGSDQPHLSKMSHGRLAERDHAVVTEATIAMHTASRHRGRGWP